MFFPHLLDGELARKDVAQHVHVHHRLLGVAGSGLIHNVDDSDALVGGDLGECGANFHQPTTWAELLAVVGAIGRSASGPRRGTALRVRDLTGALTFANVATVDTGDWVMDIAVDGARGAAA